MAQTSKHGSQAGHSAADSLNPFAADSHGEEVREIGAQAQGWQGELTHLLKHLNHLMEKSDLRHGKSGTFVHPLVIAAVITAAITGLGGILGKYFQEASARNEILLKQSEAKNAQANELYKQRLDFVAMFGDSFPKALNALYTSRKTLLWMKCYPVAYYVDVNEDKGVQIAADAAAKSEAPPKAASEKFDEQNKEYNEASQMRLQEKKPTAMCVQAIALFAGDERDEIKTLLRIVRDLQNVCDNPKPPDRFEKKNYAALNVRLEELHNAANEQFAKVLEMIGTSLNAPTK